MSPAAGGAQLTRDRRSPRRSPTSTRISHRLVVAAALLCAVRFALGAHQGRAEGPEDEEVLGLLEHWLEEPLDLRSATVQELSTFPWLDVATAEQIVGLRDAGALQSLSDLLAIPGLDASTLAALAPFVTLAAPAPRLKAGARTRVVVNTVAPPRSSLDARLGWGDAWIDARADRSLASMGRVTTRCAAGLRAASTRIWVGDLRLRAGFGLLESDPGGRSRTEPVSIGQAFGMVPQRSTSVLPRWRGVGACASAGKLRLLAASGSDPLDGAGRAAVGVETSVGEDGAVLGAAAIRTPTGIDASIWERAQVGAMKVASELAHAMPRSVRGSAMVRAGGDRWRIGAGATVDAVGGLAGEDPITGQPLDRPQASLQLDGVRRVDRWTWEALWRHVERGGPGQRQIGDRMQLTASGRASRADWRAWMRVDASAPEGQTPLAPDLQVGLRWSDAPSHTIPGDTRRHLTIRRNWYGGGGTCLLVAGSLAGAMRSGRARWTLAAATCSGDRSSLWVGSAPGVGIDSAWIAAGGARALAAATVPVLGLQFAAAAAVQGTPGRPPQPQLQIRLEVGEFP